MVALPLILTCPSCKERVKVRRVWQADLATDIGIDPDGGPYPLVDNDMYIDESGYEQYREFYCAACGADIAKTEGELMKRVKEQKDV
jgi:hypothetical protein